MCASEDIVMVTRLRRYGQIADVLIKYGFGMVLEGVLPAGAWRRVMRRGAGIERQSVYVRIRLALEDLGPTFIKFGQIMSTRRELLPPPMIEELQKLQDQVAPIPFEEIRPLIDEYCPDIGAAFEEIDEVPQAAASLAQVHRAVLKGGTEVVLKVQRPGIGEVIETDLMILRFLARQVEMRFHDMRVYNPVGMVEEFSTQIRKEIDFVRDGMNAERFAHNFRDFPGVKIPKIFWEYSGTRMLVMERIEGVRVDDVAAIRDLGADPVEIAKRGFHCYLKQVFVDGFFHGDPHPGNILVTPKRDLAFLDFGIVGVLRPEKREVFIDLLSALVENDPDLLIDAFRGLGIEIRDEDMEMVKDDLYLVVADYSEFRIGQVNIRRMVDEITTVLRRYNLSVPLSLMQVIKILFMTMDTGIRLDPHFNSTTELRHYLTELRARKTLSPDVVKKAAHSVKGVLEGAFELPRNVNEVLRKLSTGSVKLEIVDTDLVKLQRSLDRSSDKILVGLITSAVVIGSSLILLASHVTLPDQVVVIAFIGYVLALFIGFFALYHVISGSVELR